MSSQHTTIQDATNQELWRVIFADGHPALRSFQNFHRKLPSPPRCKLCLAPFRGIGGVYMALRRRGPSNRNPRYCSRCDHFIRAHPGGAEVEMSMVFVDVRGSTTLAERLKPREYAAVMNRFYSAATQVFIETDGFMIDVVGDEVLALYPPGFSGADHASRAQAAALRLLAIEVPALDGSTLDIGVGVHTGLTYIGTVEGAEEGVADVRALGDAVNTAARLASRAAAGEVLVTDSACVAAGLPIAELEHRDLELKGKSETVGVRVLRRSA